MEIVDRLFALAAGIQQWGSWQWREPQWFWLLLLIPLFLYRPLKGRKSLKHPEPWFFVSRSLKDLCVRGCGLLAAGAVIALLVLGLAHPVVEQSWEERVGVPGRVSVEIDTSGSMTCNRYDALVRYLDTLIEETERRKLPVEFGVYFFSSTNLLQMYPGAPRERIIHAAVRYGPTCPEINEYFRSKYGKKINPALGRGAGTEPAPSILDIIFDVVRSGAPELEPFVRRIQDETGFADVGNGMMPPFATYFPQGRREELIRKLREGVRGSRILFLTDAEFNVRDATLAFSRVAAFAAFIGLPIDLTAFSPGYGRVISFMGGAASVEDDSAVVDSLRPTGGVASQINSPKEVGPSAPAVENLLKRYKELPSNVRVTPKTMFDETPRQSLFAVALLLLLVWGIIRALHSIVDY